MRKILEQLYRGEIDGAEQYFSSNDTQVLREYRHALQTQEACLEKLEERLSPSEQTLLQDYLQATVQTELLEKQESFIYAFRLGAQMMLDILSDKDTAFTSIAE